MPTKENYCLKWNNFQDYANLAVGLLREDSDLVDVTLACEDGQQVEAHKVILASSSPFCMNLFKRNKNQHPIIYMMGLNLEILVPILDFIYYGEASIHHNNVESFLVLAEELKIRGLTEDVSPGQKEYTHKIDESEQSLPTTETDPIAFQNDFDFDDYFELKESVRSKMRRSKSFLPSGIPAIACTVCGEEGQYTTVKNHIEAKHIRYFSCDICGKLFKSKNSESKHFSMNHRT